MGLLGLGSRLPRGGLSRAASSSSEALVTVERKDGGVALITLNHPKTLNALTVEMGESFKALVGELREDASLRTVVLTGAGRGFSAGGSFQFLNDRAADSPTRNHLIMRMFYARFLSVRSLPVPVIAAINGPCIGAGLGLAMACDVRIAAADVPLGVPFSGLGIHPGMGVTHYLPALIGPQAAARLMLSGEPITGAEALRQGLVAEVAATPAEVLPAAMKLANRIAAQSPVAVRSTVFTLRARVDRGLEEALQREADAQASCYAAPDIKLGVAASMARTAPVFPCFPSSEHR